MAPKILFLAVSAVSVALGICLIVTSSLALDFFRPSFEICRDLVEAVPGADSTLCGKLDFWVAASSVGIVASIIQIASIGLVFLDNKPVWSAIHVIICIMAAISFGIAVSKDGLKSIEETGFPDKVKVFTVFCAIDMVVAVAAIGIVYLLEGTAH